MKSGVGVSAILGAGLGGFTDKVMRDAMTSPVSGLWDLRITLGSHVPLAIELGYLGSVAKMNTLVGAQSTTLIGTTAEAALRYNILPRAAWNPYLFAGVGWQRYDTTGSGLTLSDTGTRSSDNSVVFPMGAGVSYRNDRGLVIDARGTFRANEDAGLMLESTSGPGYSPPTTMGPGYAPLHTWEASAAVGYEF